MKKIIAAVMCSIVTFTTSATVMNSSAIDYEYHHSEYDDYSYYTCNEYTIGTFSDEKNRFSGCDLYTHEVIEAYEGMQSFITKYDYIMVPDEIIGKWFEKTMNYISSFYVKLPLHTGDEQMIIPDEAIPAPEYYELISEIQEETGIMPRIINNEVVNIEINSTEMFNAVKGDANSDEQFNIADIVTLKNFLLGKGTVGINTDMDTDNIVDIFDMILMRQYFSETFIK